MNRRIIFSGASYLIVGILSLILAVLVASAVLRKTRAQDVSSESRSASYTLAQQPVEESNVAPPPTESTDPLVNLSQSFNFLEPYVFDTREGRRNPFRPPIMVENSSQLITPGTPLERYEVDQIRLVGILWDTRIPKAMFIDPTGAVHVIGKDDRIGRRQGYIATIRESEVVIVETTNFNGELAYATKILRIDKK